jgi:hypothetical protein
MEVKEGMVVILMVGVCHHPTHVGKRCTQGLWVCTCLLKTGGVEVLLQDRGTCSL